MIEQNSRSTGTVKYD